MQKLYDNSALDTVDGCGQVKCSHRRGLIEGLLIFLVVVLAVGGSADVGCILAT